MATIPKVVTGNQGRGVQLQPGPGNNQYVRASDFNPLVDQWNGISGASATSVTASSTPTINAAVGSFTTGTLSAVALAASTITVTNSLVATTSVILVSIGTYSGTIATNGIPVLYEVTPSAGSFVIKIANVHATNALSGTLAIKFIVH